MDGRFPILRLRRISVPGTAIRMHLRLALDRVVQVRGVGGERVALDVLDIADGRVSDAGFLGERGDSQEGRRERGAYGAEDGERGHVALVDYWDGDYYLSRSIHRHLKRLVRRLGRPSSLRQMVRRPKIIPLQRTARGIETIIPHCDMLGHIAIRIDSPADTKMGAFWRGGVCHWSFGVYDYRVRLFGYHVWRYSEEYDEGYGDDSFCALGVCCGGLYVLWAIFDHEQWILCSMAGMPLFIEPDGY